jgi:hypothetical protein
VFLFWLFHVAFVNISAGHRSVFEDTVREFLPGKRPNEKATNRIATD